MSISQNFPNTRPSLNLNFARSKTLDPRITFTRTSTATYVDEDGLIKTAPANSPRFDHDPVTGESLGLLIEESRTNLISYSQDFTNALWQTGINRATCNATTGIDDPSGGTTASRWSSGTSTSQELIYRLTGTSTGVLTGQTCTKSIWIRRISNNGTVSFFIGDNVGVSVNSQLDSVPVGTWVRCSITRTIVGNNGDTRNYIAVYPGTDGQPTTIDIWGDQVEIGSFPTSYIPTTTSTATRTPDNAKIEGSNFSSWYNPTESSVFWSGRLNATLPSGYFGAMYSIDSGTGVTLRGFYNPFNAFGSYVYVNGSSTAQTQITTVPGKFEKMATRWKQNDYTTSFNGDNISTFGGNYFPSGLIRLNIGSNNGTVWGVQTISKIVYYPVSLTNSQLQTLTK